MKSGSAQFDAYGRRFSLTLTDNNRRSRQAFRRAQAAVAGLYVCCAASLDGAPGSWVRLTESAVGCRRRDLGRPRPLHGHALREHRAVPHHAHRRRARPDRGVPALGCRDMLPRDFCELADDAVMAKAAQRARPVPRGSAAARGGRLSPRAHAPDRNLADRRHRRSSRRRSADPTAAMLARLNIVEGIFSEQVGLLMLATDVRLMPAGRRSVHAHQGRDAARAARHLSRGDAGSARARSRASDDGQGSRRHHGRHRLRAHRVRRRTRRVGELAFVRHHDLRADHGARARPQLRRGTRRRGGHGLRGRRRRLHHGARR